MTESERQGAPSRYGLLKGLKSNLLNYSVALVCVYGNGSWLYVENNQYYTLFLIVLVWLLVFHDGSKRSLEMPNIFLIVLLIYPIIATAANVTENFNLFNLVATTVLTTAVAFLRRQRIVDILDCYAEWIVILMIIGVALGMLSYLVPLGTFLPMRYSEFGPSGYYNLLVYTDRAFQDLRLQSIYWEPGAWAVNQGFAFIWLIIRNRPLKYYPVFALSFALTLSTTGIALFAIMSAYLVFHRYRGRYYGHRIILVAGSLIVAGVVALSSVSDLFGLDFERMVYLNTIGKFTAGSASFHSHESRLATTAEAFEIAAKKPLFGAGRRTDLYTTSTIAQILYQTGFVYTALYLLAFWFSFNKIHPLFSVPYIIILLNGEVMGYFILYTLLIMNGSKIALAKS